jgi:site-specific DNA-adenine methylase
MPYFGGKMMLADRIIATFPAHGHYVEPFAGSLAVLLAKAPADHETVNDLDGDLVTFWRVLRDRQPSLSGRARSPRTPGLSTPPPMTCPRRWTRWSAPGASGCS